MVSVGKGFSKVCNLLKGNRGVCTVDMIGSNTPGRILRMQNAKDAFNFQGRTGASVVYKEPMKLKSNIHLETSDTFVQRHKALYPDALSPDESLKHRFERYKDVKAAFADYVPPEPKTGLLGKIKSFFS